MFKAKERKTEEPGEEALDDGELVRLFRISDSLLRALRDFWRSYTGKDGDTLVSLALLPSPPPPIQPPDCSLNWAWGKTLQGGQWSRTGLLVTGMQAMAAEMEKGG